MVLFYTNDGIIKKVEHKVMTPSFPDDMDASEKAQYYKEEEGLNYIGLPYELKADVFEHRVVLDESGSFVGLVFDEELSKSFKGDLGLFNF